MSIPISGIKGFVGVSSTASHIIINMSVDASSPKSSLTIKLFVYRKSLSCSEQLCRSRPGVGGSNPSALPSWILRNAHGREPILNGEPVSINQRFSPFFPKPTDNESTLGPCLVILTYTFVLLPVIMLKTFFLPIALNCKLVFELVHIRR